MKKVIVFTDGAARGNPGPAGWGAIIKLILSQGEARIKELGGREETSTNNRMEMQAAIETLTYLAKEGINSRVPITIYTDSNYLVKGITGWVFGWQKNGWQTKAGSDVQNKDLWEALLACVQDLNVAWTHLPGHVGIPGNERADEIATDYADGRKTPLFAGKESVYDVDLSIKQAASKEKKRGHKSKTTYSYLSLVDGEARRHSSWSECKKRVEGKPAKYRKTFSAEHEREILESWGVDPSQVRPGFSN